MQKTQNSPRNALLRVENAPSDRFLRNSSLIAVDDLLKYRGTAFFLSGSGPVQSAFFYLEMSNVIDGCDIGGSFISFCIIGIAADLFPPVSQPVPVKEPVQKNSLAYMP